MKDHIKRQTLIRPTHEPWDQDQVGRTADWQKLRYSLYSAEDDGLNEGHSRSAKCEEPGSATWQNENPFDASDVDIRTSPKSPESPAAPAVVLKSA